MSLTSLELTHREDEAGLELTEPASVSRVLGLRVCTIKPLRFHCAVLFGFIFETGPLSPRLALGLF